MTNFILASDIEYANGLQATVVFADGEWAVLEQKADGRVPHGFIVARGNPEEFTFPFEDGDLLHPTCGAAVVQIADAKATEQPTRWRREFPDFDPADMPAWPEGFTDSSWANEACPSIQSEATGLMVFIDYADPEKREYDGCKRFALHALVDGDDGWQLPDEPEVLCESDDWAEILAAIAKAEAEGAPLPPDLHKEVVDLESGKAWLRCLVKAGLSFHLEDSPETIIDEHGKPLFRRADIPMLHQRVAALYALEWGPKPGLGKDYCPIGFMMTVEPFDPDNQAVGFEEGAEMYCAAAPYTLLDVAHVAGREYEAPGRFVVHNAETNMRVRYDTPEEALAAFPTLKKAMEGAMAELRQRQGA